MRFSVADILRLLGAHLAAAIAGGIVFAFVRSILAAPAIPGVWPIVLLAYLASVQIMIVGGGAACLAVLTTWVAPRFAPFAFPASGALVAVVLSVVVGQLNLTFLAPAIAAGVAYGVAWRWFGWRRLQFAETD